MARRDLLIVLVVATLGLVALRPSFGVAHGPLMQFVLSDKRINLRVQRLSVVT